MSDHDIPRERDLPPGRLAQMKDDLMAHIEDTDRHDPTDRRVVDLTARPRWRRVGVAAAVAVAAGIAVSGVLVVGGGDSASASPNFAQRTDDGYVRVYVEDLEDLGHVEQDLADLGVSADVTIHDRDGQRCDDGRSDDWLEEFPAGLMPDEFADVANDPLLDFKLDPGELQPGQSLAIEFWWDEHEGDWTTLASFRVSATPLGECEVVEDDAVIVDAEAGISGG